MSLSSIIALLFILFFLGMMIIYTLRSQKPIKEYFREIPAYTRLKRSIGFAVESGARLHISLGRGSITSAQSTTALVGLSMLEQITRAASMSDCPPVATAGDATLTILAQDTLRNTYKSIGVIEQLGPIGSRVLGLTPFSFAAGSLPIIQDENISSNLLVGNFGSEIGLITDAGERTESLTFAGTENIPTQAVIYATANELLIGEELYAGGAYLQAGPMHNASLHAQDIIRWVLIMVILVGFLLRISGLDRVIVNFLRGFI